MQAALTEPAPAHLMGGTVLPLSAGGTVLPLSAGGNTTTGARGAHVTHPYNPEVSVMFMQVALTEPAPVHLMGGTVLPLSAGRNTTAAARGAPLTLLVAFPGDAAQKPDAGPVRCGPSCAAGTPGVLPACGHMCALNHEVMNRVYAGLYTAHTGRS